MPTDENNRTFSTELERGFDGECELWTFEVSHTRAVQAAKKRETNKKLRDKLHSVWCIFQMQMMLNYELICWLVRM